ncbi:threonine dehydrogenase-like Zn-dependent dehydrogenase [Paraburkholderia sp. BL18I3N2]|nr:threonine dehydrogenase-like Zn-dependent dehydrogenase [Paraburkholderia sp. BL18I3N2]
MVNKVLAQIRVGPGELQLREFDMPEVADDCALMRVEVAGICGTDVKMYKEQLKGAPIIMGHENIGILEKAGSEFLKRTGLKIGDRIFPEHYTSCGQCEHCHSGQYRHCIGTDWRFNPKGIRLGYTAIDNDHSPLLGGLSQYIYLPANAVVHKVPDGLDPELAGVVTPMANGIEWALFDCNVGYDTSVLIQGPGQQGLSQVVACKQAGASMIIVTGTAKDSRRLKIAKELGADVVIDVTAEDPLEKILEATNGRGVDVALDCTAGAGTKAILLGIEALKRKCGTLLIQGEMADFPNFPIGKVTVKAITIKSARGHSYKACELALKQLASKRFPLEKITTHRFALKDADVAIKAVGGAEDAIHVSIMPWM